MDLRLGGRLGLVGVSDLPRGHSLVPSPAGSPGETGSLSNALWHQRVIEALIRLGGPIEAMQAVHEAYARVDPHPRRDELLRVRPAGTAMRSGLPLLSLELTEPVLDLPADLYPEVADGCRTLLRRWEKGLAVPDLPFHVGQGAAEGRLVFHAPVEIDVRRTRDTWTAHLHGLASEGRADQPRGAIEALARHLADEACRFVSTPSSNLGVKDAVRSGDEARACG